MCYNYEDLEHRARKSWKHAHPGEDSYVDSGKSAVETAAGEEKDESLYPGRVGRVILLGENETREGYFGLLSTWNQSFADSRKFNTFNCRNDSILTKTTWKAPWAKKQRCIVETTGFFETDKKTKKKYRFTVGDKQVFYYGGLYNWWTNPTNGDKLLTYAIITTEPNEIVSPYHNRMPWIVEQDVKQNWMTPDFNIPDLLSMMKPYPAFLMSCIEIEVEPRAKKGKDTDQGSLGF
jgi:putative SOS response-associated peptidase YedK